MRRTLFHRVSDCLAAAGGITSVCIRTHDRLQDLLRLAYDDISLVNSAIRAASRDLVESGFGYKWDQDGIPGSWSQHVVDKALQKLAGAYMPEKAAALAQARLAAAQLAAENNAAWDGV